ncbi:MAG: alpha/beta hydrolase [Calditrichaeota bacterium]|nr:MAG: alpha/beta hydrolase [Calditrichota bacterium]MBL1207041.1 alpha/beta hydrolase [Calditrichota bacterium]NOG46869.1 alpha/beta hydrolase [Calditrichota bacterium]
MIQIKFKVIVLTIFLTIISCTKQDDIERYLQFKDHSVYYEVRGNASKALFFIHGWTGSTKAWKYQLDNFPGYKIIAIDLPGNGKSSKNDTTNYTMELFADAINAIIKKENINEAFFIGHSMGFAIAEIVAVKYPETCKGIISVDGAHFELPEDPKAKEEWIQYNRMFVKSLENEKGRENFMNALFLPDTPQLLKDEIFEISREVPLSIGRSMIEAAETDQKYWTKRIMDIPCLAIYSPAYQLPPDYEVSFRNSFPKVEYHEVKNVSHFFMLEIPYKTNQIISDYLLKEYK